MKCPRPVGLGCDGDDVSDEEAPSMKDRIPSLKERFKPDTRLVLFRTFLHSMIREKRIVGARMEMERWFKVVLEGRAMREKLDQSHAPDERELIKKDQKRLAEEATAAREELAAKCALVVNDFSELWTEWTKSLQTDIKVAGLERQVSPGPRSWSDHRGHGNETLLSWVYLNIVRDSKREDLVAAYRTLLMGMLHANPELVNVVFDGPLHEGRTILHQACANQDIQILVWVLGLKEALRHTEDYKEFQRVVLNGNYTGSFVHDVMRRPDDIKVLDGMITPSAKPFEFPEMLCHADCSAFYQVGQTPLEVVLLGSDKDDVCIYMLKLLLEAGADPVFCDPAGQPMYTLLHVVARCRWLGEGPYLISEERTKKVVQLFMDAHSSVFHKFFGPSDKNAAGLTPLQCAALVGNEVCFVEMLDWMKVFIWKWGDAQQAGFPLRELDSAASSVDVGALELMTLFKRANLLRIHIMANIIEAKWKKFGLPSLMYFLLLQSITSIMFGIVCLDDAVEYRKVRYFARMGALALGIGGLLQNILLYYICASDEIWFRTMAVRHRKDKIDIWQVLVVRSTFDMLCLVILSATAPFSLPELAAAYPAFPYWWSVLVSTWWMVFFLHLLRYFELFSSTAPLAAALPIIWEKDMVSFLAIYSTAFMCSAVALRVSSEGTGPGNGSKAAHEADADAAVGTFTRTLMTLEESIHGPDVQWRAVIEHHSFATTTIFIMFLWVTLIMMSMLISMFGSRWQELRDHMSERLLFRRAMWTLSLEKMSPMWLYESGRFAIGEQVDALLHDELTVARDPHVKRRVLRALSCQDQSAGERARRPSDVGLSLTLQRVWSYGRGFAAGESQPLLGDQVDPEADPEADERYLLWSGGRDTFGDWKRERNLTEPFAL